MPDPISTLALATGGVFLGKFVGPAAEHLGKQALERAQQLGAKATALLTAAGREPQPVEPKLLVPLVQAASLETEETLAERWAALLANAADPAQRVVVQPGFAEVLRQLTSDDAQMLQFVYRKREVEGLEPLAGYLTVGEIIISFLGLSGGRAEMSFDNLLRLRLCELLTHGTNNDSLELSAKQVVLPTMYGRQFLAAVTPPTP